jgi:hypothetical protein
MNTGIITLMTNANFEYAPFPFSLIPIHNQYPSFNSHWFMDIGFSLEKSMIITAIYPWLEILIFGGIVHFKRWKDSGYIRRIDPRRTTTKCTT